MSAERYVALAEIARPHGVRGELRLKVYNPDSEVLLQRPAVRLVDPDGKPRKAAITSVRPVPGALLVKLEGVVGRDQAESLRGWRIEVARSQLDAVEEADEFYVCDLQGCRVWLEGRDLGVVINVASYPTCDALVVERHKGEGRRKLEIPMNADYVASVDLDAQRVELVTIEGLE